MREVRFGIIGLGSIGVRHAKYLETTPGARLTAVSDISAKNLSRFADRSDLKVFGHWNQLMDSGAVDAVIIATPHFSHPEIASAAFAHGLHVLCEKPIAVTVGQARRLNSDYARYPHLKFGLMLQTRAYPIYQHLRRIVQGGELGPVSRITWIVTDWFRPWSYFAGGGWRATWAGEGGGVLINQAPHNLDLLQWIPGLMPKRITAVARIGKSHPIEVEDEISALLEYDNGAIGHFVASTGEAPGTNRLEICGDWGKIIADEEQFSFHKTEQSVSHLLKTGPERCKVNTQVIQAHYPKPPEHHRAIIINFVNSILNDEPLLAPGVEGVLGLEIGNAMLMAGIRRKAVELPLDDGAYEAFLKEMIESSARGKK